MINSKGGRNLRLINMNIKLTSLALWGVVLTGTMATLQAAGNGSGPIATYLTAKDSGQRLARMADLTFAPMPQPTEHQACVFLDPTKTFQTLVGIGGALTDASAETFYKLPRAGSGNYCGLTSIRRSASDIRSGARPSTAATFRVRLTLTSRKAMRP
jgi:hypothetical protein